MAKNVRLTAAGTPDRRCTRTKPSKVSNYRMDLDLLEAMEKRLRENYKRVEKDETLELPLTATDMVHEALYRYLGVK